MTLYQPNSDITELKLSDIPEGTTKLKISESPITKLPNILPSTLKDFILDFCFQLNELPDNLPESLINIQFFGCIKITNLPELPLALEKLDLTGCDNLNNLPELPGNLKMLNLSGCRINNLPRLPESLERIRLLGCNSLNNLPELPESLERLNLSICINLNNLPRLPGNLKRLNLSECRINNLPRLPESLEKLNLSGCANLTNLPKLPESLEKLDLSGCENLTNLPKLPESLEKLDLSGCTSLPNNAETINKLIELETRNQGNAYFQLIWPEHFDRNPEIAQIKLNLKAAYKDFYATNDDFRDREVKNDPCFPTYHLMHRFVTESVRQRGEDVILKEALKVSEIIKDNPSLLEATDKSAEDFLAHCVNKPVAGFAEIAVLAEIAIQPDIPAKLEKAKILVAEELINHEVKNLKPGASFEVELGNAMLREVHKNLLADKIIDEPWPGIPEGVAYQHFVENYLTEKNIADISKKVSEELKSLTQEKVSEVILENRFQDFWALITVDEEKRDELNLPYIEAVNEITDSRSERSANEIEELKNSCRERILKESKELTLKAIKPPITSSHGAAADSPRSTMTLQEAEASRLEGDSPRQI